MNLILLSKKTDKLNKMLDQKIRSDFLEKKSKAVYLSLGNKINDKDYDLTSTFLKKYGIQILNLVDINNPNLMKVKKSILEHSVVYIPSVNPIEAINNLKKFNLKNTLNEFFDNGGKVIVEGMSCVLFSDGMEIFDELILKSDKEVNKGLGIIGFNCIPNWNEYKAQLCNIVDSSRKYEGVYYGVNDGNGIEINDDDVIFYGDIIKIEDGSFDVFKGL